VSLPAGPSWGRPRQTLAWATRPTPFLKRCHDRYGDAFTITIGQEPPWVVLAHPDAVKEVFAGDPEVFHAGEGNEVLRPVVGERSVLILDDAEHLRARKLLLPPFHGERLKVIAATMRDVAEREVATWPAGEVRVHPHTQALTLEIIMRTIFGSEDPRLHDAIRTLTDNIGGPVGIALMVVLGPKKLPQNRLFRSQMDPVDALLYETIRARRAEGGLAERDDILSLLLEAGMDDREARDELVTLLTAGHETTATALAWAVERLVRHPEAWEGLRSGDEAWADAVVKETLRLRPVLPIVIRRLTRDVEVAGMPLPAGVAAVPCIWLVHRRPDVYPDPHAFKPERWLGTRPGTSTWFPFGGGVRRCIGAAFAEMEMRIALQVIARHVDLVPASPTSERVTRRAITFTPHRGGEVLATPRNRSAAGAVQEAEKLTV
jgi:cytochrome P450